MLCYHIIIIIVSHTKDYRKKKLNRLHKHKFIFMMFWIENKMCESKYVMFGPIRMDKLLPYMKLELVENCKQCTFLIWYYNAYCDGLTATYDRNTFFHKTKNYLQNNKFNNREECNEREKKPQSGSILCVQCATRYNSLYCKYEKFVTSALQRLISMGKYKWNEKRRKNRQNKNKILKLKRRKKVNK